MLQRRHRSLLSSLCALSLLGACATGQEDGFGGLSGAYSAGPAGGSEGGETEGEETEGEEGPAPTSAGGTEPPPGDASSGGDDVGNPLCCEAHPSGGCDSMLTESCVCTNQPSCCQAVWSQECVDLAIACGDPFCEDDSGGESTGEPPEEPPPEEPPPEEPPPGDPFPSCPCVMQAEFTNFCHHGPSTPGCPMTAPGGYCDPNGDGSYDPDANWVQGWTDYQVQCT